MELLVVTNCCPVCSKCTDVAANIAMTICNEDAVNLLAY